MRDRKRDRQTERDRERQRECVCVFQRKRRVIDEEENMAILKDKGGSIYSVVDGGNAMESYFLH